MKYGDHDIKKERRWGQRDKVERLAMAIQRADGGQGFAEVGNDLYGQPLDSNSCILQIQT